MCKLITSAQTYEFTFQNADFIPHFLGQMLTEKIAFQHFFVLITLDVNACKSRQLEFEF